MTPKITDPIAWQQAEMLMQPVMLRLVDNIRKQLENSEWNGTYENVRIPIPGYLLRLKHQDRQIDFDIWELCYQICFRDYKRLHSDSESQNVEIDTSLIEETGDVDWERLEVKTQQVVNELFASLPSISTKESLG